MDKKGDLTQEEAVDLIDRCMKLLYYRDARSLNKVGFIYTVMVLCIHFLWVCHAKGNTGVHCGSGKVGGAEL